MTEKQQLFAWLTKQVAKGRSIDYICDALISEYNCDRDKLLITAEEHKTFCDWIEEFRKINS